jgi:MFS family permease
MARTHQTRPEGRGVSRRVPLPFPRPRPGAPSIWSRALRPLTAGLLLTIIGFAFEAMAVATALPVTLRELGGLPLYGWAFSALQLTMLLGTVASGLLADKYGLVRPFILGVALFAFGLLIAGLAPSMEVVVAGRAVQGLGTGLLASAAYVAVARGYPADTKPRMLAAMSSAWILPGLIGPMVAGAVADHLSWRLVFLALVPLMPVTTALALPAMRGVDRMQAVAGAPAREAVARARNALGLAAGMGLLLGGLSNAATPALGLVLIAAGAALVGLTAPRLLPRGTLRARRGLPAAIATGGLLTLGFFGAEAFFPLALITVHGVSTTTAGLALGAAAITWASGSWLQSRLTAAGRRGTLIIAGASILTAAVAAATTATVASVPPFLPIAAWIVAALGMGLAFSTTSLVVLEASPPGSEGTTAAALQLSQTLGSAIGTGAGGALLGLASAAGWHTATGIRLVDALTVSVLALAAVAGSRAPRHRPQRATTALDGHAA